MQARAIPDKWSPPHSSSSSAPIHQSIDLPGSARSEKFSPAEHPSLPAHPSPTPPISVPHPNLPLEASEAPPSKLVNDKPATHLVEEKEKK